MYWYILQIIGRIFITDKKDYYNNDHFDTVFNRFITIIEIIMRMIVIITLFSIKEYCKFELNLNKFLSGDQFIIFTYILYFILFMYI